MRRGSKLNAQPHGIGGRRRRGPAPEPPDPAAIPMRTRCHFCGDDHEGTLASGGEWIREHVRERHPEVAAG